MYFESHAHYDDRRFDDDRDELLGTILPESGVEYIVNCGADMRSSQSSISFSDKYNYIYAAIGVHPHSAKNMKDSDLQLLEKWASHKKVVAIGEIGLDYHYDFSPRDIQVKRFKEQLSLAKSLNLPVIIHSREASQETFDIIIESGIGSCGAVIHCYSGSAEMAIEYVKRGFYIGVGGVITYSNAKRLVDTVKNIPLEHILLETDCPYLSPSPNRGQRNDSRNLKYICDEVANIKQLDTSLVAYETMKNAKTLFNLE